MRCIDLLVFRGISLANTVMDNFDAAEEGEEISFQYSLPFFIFFAYIPFSIDMLFPSIAWSDKETYFYLTDIKYSCYYDFFRFEVCYYDSTIVWSYHLILFKENKIFLLKWFCGGIFTFFSDTEFLIGSLFLNRLSEMGMTGAMSVVSEHGGYSDKVPATPEFVQLLNDSESTFYYPYLFAYSHICQYFTHAVFEFPVVKGYIDQTDKYFYGGGLHLVYFIN